VNGLTSRRLWPRDAAQLRTLARECYVPYYAHLWQPGGMERYLSDTYDDERLQRELSDPSIDHELVCVDATPVGFVRYHARRDTAELPNAACLERIYLHPSRLGHGIGSAVMHRYFDRARSEGRDRLWLEAMTTAEKPLARYLALGFRVCGETRLAHPLVRPEWAAMLTLVRELHASAV
jgi:GNAT superfamily N-acetyltransferase